MARILIGNIKGPKGDTGPRGATGPTGPVGPQGPLPPLTNNFLATVAGQAALDAVAGKTLKDQLDKQNSDKANKTDLATKADASTVAAVISEVTELKGKIAFEGLSSVRFGKNLSNTFIDLRESATRFYRITFNSDTSQIAYSYYDGTKFTDLFVK